MREDVNAVLREAVVVASCAGAALAPPVRRLDDWAFKSLHTAMAATRRRRVLWWLLSQAGWFGSAVIWSAFLVKTGRGRAGLRLIVSAALAWSAAQALKKATGIERPWDRLEGVRRTGGIPTGSSFPAGHPSVAAAVAAAVRKDPAVPLSLRGTLLVLSLLVPPARIGVGAHYPLDVVAGYFLGDMVGRLVRTASR